MNRLLKVSMALSLLLSIPLMADESFGGVGITIVPAKEGVRVVEVIPGTPAAEAGVLPEDRICAVDAVSITGKSFDAARDALRGQKGKPVEISVITSFATEVLIRTISSFTGRFVTFINGAPCLITERERL